jgi:hypothetical protein
VSLVGVSATALAVACGARTELGIPERGDAAEGEDSSSDSQSSPDSPFFDVAPFDTGSADVTTDIIEECIPPGGRCTSASECCDSLPCMADMCGFAALYGMAPPP